ncbi:enoyl-CoA hydratase/isomerase family protein [Streptomyces humi]
MQQLRYTLKNDVAHLVLDNPPHNRISNQMREDLAEAVQRVKDDRARAVLVASDASLFSLGGDIEPWVDLSTDELRSTFERYMEVYNSFERLNVPTVAAVEGLCMGGGFELAVRCDVIFASESAQFGHPEQGVGVVPVLGGIHRLAERAGRAKAMEWALTGAALPAPELEQFGIVNRVVKSENLRADATAFAEQLAQGPTRAYAAHKALLRVWAAGGISAADDAMFDLTMPLWDTEDVKTVFPAAVKAMQAGQPRSQGPFQGR